MGVELGICPLCPRSLNSAVEVSMHAGCWCAIVEIGKHNASLEKVEGVTEQNKSREISESEDILLASLYCL